MHFIISALGHAFNIIDKRPEQAKNFAYFSEKRATLSTLREDLVNGIY